jgi:predicted secreted protein
MASNAFLGVGTVFSRSETETGTYTALAEVLNIDGPTMTRDTPEVTNLDSEGGYKEFIAGFRDAGNITLPMNFTHVTYEAMLDDFEDDSAKWYRIDMPNTQKTRLQFQGLVTSCPVSIQTASQVTSNVSIKISGKVELSQEAS